MKKLLLLALKCFIAYFLASIILFEIIPTSILIFSAITDGRDLSDLPPFLLHRSLADFGYVLGILAIFGLLLMFLHISVRYLFFRKPSPLSTFVFPILKRIDRNLAGRIFLRWIIPLPVAFLFTQYAFSEIERHMEDGKVGCWDTGFPFTYSAGCSTPPPRIPGIEPPKTKSHIDETAYSKNLRIYFGTALFSVFFANLLLFARNRPVRLYTRYVTAVLFVFTVAPPWMSGYNGGILQIGAPYIFLSRYYERGIGDKYSFDAKGFSIDLVAGFSIALLMASAHLILRRLSQGKRVQNWFGKPAGKWVIPYVKTYGIVLLCAFLFQEYFFGPSHGSGEFGFPVSYRQFDTYLPQNQANEGFVGDLNPVLSRWLFGGILIDLASYAAACAVLTYLYRYFRETRIKKGGHIGSEIAYEE